ncbi:serine-rich adhesin for platelets-like [Gigantopelta aegis]|uniref:serine-rich adhesin for platelets-like n=1 Tax=Gigantopelta aegis TaxID=1735272 RepID=UPI001B88E530|nr:serine-rich adhesin for platelets-like [Gigantopelta aegis]
MVTEKRPETQIKVKYRKRENMKKAVVMIPKSKKCHLLTLNNPAVVNALAKLRKNGNKENPLSGSSDHSSSLISDASYAYSQLYGESSTSQVLSNTDTNGKSRRMANSGFEHGDRKASRDADKSEIQKKRKYEEGSRDDSKKQKVSPSVSARGRTAKRIVDKYPGSSGPANRQREKHHTRNGDPGDKTLDSCFRGDKHSLDNGTKEDKKAHENDKRKGEKETSLKKDEKEKSVRKGEKSVRKGEKSVRKDHIYEREKKTISTSKTDHSTIGATEKYDQKERNDKRRKGEKEKTVRKVHIYDRDKKTISTFKTDHSTIGATEKYDQKERNDKRRKGKKEKTVRKDHIYERNKKTTSTSKTDHSTIGATEKYDRRERNDKRRKGEQKNNVTKDHIYERDKNTRDTSKSDHSAIGATGKYDQRERNCHSDKTRHKRLDPRTHQSSPSSKGLCTENNDLGNGATHLTPISEKRAILEDDVEHKDSISHSDKKKYTEPGQHGIKTRDSPIHLTQGLPNLVSMECIDHNIIPVSSPVLQEVVDMESGVANVEQNNCPDSSQVSPKTISKEADDLGNTSHAPLISQKTVILEHNPSPNNICRDDDNKSNSSRVLAKSIGLEHVHHVKQVDDVHYQSIILERTLNVKGDVKAVKQRNRASNIPLPSLKRKWAPDGDTTTKQSDSSVHLVKEVILEGGDHIDDEVNHLLLSPKKIHIQYTTVYSPSSNSENNVLKGLSSAAETDETNDHGKGAKCLETDEINDHGKGARCLETDETNDHGNDANCLETDETNDHGKGARCLETDETNDHGKGAKCLETDEINNHGNGAKCLDIGNPDSNKNESAVANMESNILKLVLENIKQKCTAPSAVLSSGNDAELHGDAESEDGNALDKEQPYILHRIENVPQEIKSWKSRLEKFKKSNYSLCETWEYTFFSNVSAHKSVSFNTFENTSVNTSTPQSKPHALGVNDKSSESYHLTSNENAILSQSFSAECDKGSEASDLAVPVDDAESQGDALDNEQPYVLHKIENIPQEIKSWKSRLEKFKNSNYSLCETWEYPFFSNVSAHKSVSFNTFENTSVNTSTPQSKPHALGVNEELSESNHLTFNESAILSQSFCAEYDMGSEASGLAVPIDNAAAEFFKGSEASDLAVPVDDTESQGDALDDEHPYVLHKIENIPLEIKSWKSRLEKFRKSNYSLCETWEYPFFSNEIAILSETFSAECNKGSEASGLAVPVDENSVTQNVEIQNHSHLFKLDHSQQTANQSRDVCDPNQMTIPDVSAISDTKIKHIERYLPDCEASCSSSDAYCLASNCGSGFGGVKLEEKHFLFKRNSSVANVTDNVDSDLISDCVVENRNTDIDADKGLPLRDTMKKSLPPARYSHCDDGRLSISDDLHVIQVYLDDSESCDCVYTQDSSLTLSEMVENSFDNGTCKLFDRDTLTGDNVSDKSSIVTDNDECCNSFTVANSRCDKSVDVSVEDTGWKSSFNTGREQLDVSANDNEKPGSITRGDTVVIPGEEAITEFLSESTDESVTFLEGCARTRLYIKSLKSNNTVNIQTSLNSLETAITEDLSTHSHSKMCIPGKQSVCEIKLSDLSPSPVTKNNMLNTAYVQMHCEKNTINLEENKDSHNVVQDYVHHDDKENREVPQQTLDSQNLTSQKTNSETKDMMTTNSVESSDDSDSSDSSDEKSSSSSSDEKSSSSDEKSSSSDEESSSSSSDEESSSSSSNEESSSSDDTSSDSDSDVGERNSVYPASSGIHNNSQQTVNGSDKSNVCKLFDRLKPLNELFSSMLSNQNRRTEVSKRDVSKVSKTSVSNTQPGKAKDSKAKDTTAKIVSDKSDTISDKDNPVYSENSIGYPCISLDDEDCSLQLRVISDEEISDDSSLEDGELRSESPDDYIVSKRLTERKPNFEPLIKLKTQNISASTSGQQRGQRKGTKLSMDLYRPMTGESHSSNQATKAFSTLKGYKIPRKNSLGSQKRPFSDAGSTDRTPKRKRLEKSPSQSVGW